MDNLDTEIRSSYRENNFGEILQQYVLTWKPVSFVELGVLDGYSTLFIAQGVKQNQKMHNINAKLDAYDLFDDYAFKHGNQESVNMMLKEHGVGDYVNLIKGNAYEVYSRYPNMIPNEVKGIEFLHIDISNTGKVIHDLMELWHPKIGWRGVVAIEGGSDERDNVEWMKKYNMPSIKVELSTSELISKYYFIATYFKFPSLTILIRKWWN